MSTSFSRRVWAGDKETVKEARRKYLADPEGKLIDFASTLYSFPRHSEFERELIGLCDLLSARATNHLREERGGSREERAKEVEPVATYLEWLSRNDAFPHLKRRGLHIQALELCQYGIHLCGSDFYGDHTPYLIRLTMAQLYLNQGSDVLALYLLGLVQAEASSITDPNQRTRVYRKLGFLYRRCGYYFSALRWGVSACLVLDRRVPLFTRLKSAAALFGIER